MRSQSTINFGQKHRHKLVFGNSIDFHKFLEFFYRRTRHTPFPIIDTLLIGVNVGDIVVPYLKDHGYVGIGCVVEKACPVTDFKVKGKPLSSYDLVEPNIYKKRIEDQKECDQLVRVDWIKSVGRDAAIWKTNAGLFTKQLIVASLEHQPKTLAYLETHFEVNFKSLLNNEEKAA